MKSSFDEYYRFFSWVTPNQLTMLRIILVPVLMLLLFFDRPWGNVLALVVFTVAGATDYIDGNLARYRGEVTSLGRLLDPIADKMLVTATLVMLVAAGHAGPVPTIIVLMREFAISALRQVAAMDGVPLPPVEGVKWKTTLQMVATGTLIMSNNPFGWQVEIAGKSMLWAAALLTMWTGYSYFSEYFRSRAEADKS
ncbi:MAG: CDP-diacylglycerol--glycerol-3-phosphate 3-phosphatidyltransferase [Deltaproteobacteria bacterium]|nr:CDP-diacylglycerol--glycerol-3-phosphate 3-phosphatidyltransferase [Deltaproteobacteria bacterium]